MEHANHARTWADTAMANLGRPRATGEALLAIFEEQRTANLIALLDRLPAGSSQRAALLAQIDSRLGLGGAL